MSEVQKRTNVRLSMQEDFALTKWLHARDMQPGETITDLVQKARTELKIDKINYNHMQTRLIEFDIKLVPLPEKDGNKRVAKLEALVHALICGMAKSGFEMPDLLNRYIAEYPGKIEL